MVKIHSLKSGQAGVAFGDQIISERVGKRRNYDDSFRGGNMRSIVMIIFLVVSLLLLSIKLFGLQILQGKYFRNLSDNNRIKTTIIHAPRGTIFDRNGKPLVYNVPGYRETVNGKTKLLTQDEAISLIAKGQKNLEIDSLRQYPYKEIASHVLGYLGQISTEELKTSEFSDYSPGEIIGETGIESEYEHNLRGIDGKELSEVDSLGGVIRKLGQTDPVPGQDIELTLDIDIQNAAFNAMKGVKKGAAIVSKPDGEILAMVSKPSFDPNLFTMGENYKAASESGYTDLSQVLLDGTNQPLLNRAISGTYPPGSTFKIIAASAGLNDGAIDRNYTVDDTGVVKVGAFSFANWYFTQYGRTEGAVNVVKALQRSNDIFFYKLAEKLGIDRISKMANLFGAGKTLGIDLIGEAKGLVPTEEWKKKAIGEQWYLGDTYHYGIGQGYMLSTPLQVNSWAQIIANQGTLFRPHLLKNAPQYKLNANFLNEKTINLVREGMIEACSTGGVAWPLFNYTIKNPNLKIDGKNILEAPISTTSASAKDFRKVVIACKTGTAETTPTQEPHAWITVFAPAYNPQVVVTVLSEESGEGSNVAGPIAKKILDSYFGNLK